MQGCQMINLVSVYCGNCGADLTLPPGEVVQCHCPAKSNLEVTPGGTIQTSGPVRFRPLPEGDIGAV